VSFAAERGRHCTLSELHAYEAGRRHAAWDFARQSAAADGSDVVTPDTIGIIPYGVHHRLHVCRHAGSQGFRFGGFLGMMVGPQTNSCTVS
jgi:hypothetical protein